jgi:hypothetical protein
MPHYQVELSEILNANPDFETGDLTGWNDFTEDNSGFTLVSVGTGVFTGDFSARLMGVESQFNTGRSDVFSIDNKYKYNFKGYTRISSLFANSFRIRIRQYENADDNVSSQFLINNVVVDSDIHAFQLESFVLGPSGSNVDVTVMDCTNGLSIEAAFPDESSGNLAYFDNFTLLNLVDVTPEHDNEWSLSEVQLRNQNRAANGALFVRKQGDYNRITIGQVNMAMENATVINSWYGDNKELLLEISSGDSVTSFSTEPFSVMIVNNDSPFQERILPYDGEFQGMIELEGY